MIRKALTKAIRCGIRCAIGHEGGGGGGFPEFYPYTSQSWYSDGMGSGSGGLLQPESPFGVRIALDSPTQYTDASRVWLKSYRYLIGTTSGVYTIVVDPAVTENPLAPERRINGLDEGVTYYMVVQAIDHAGVVSSSSNEITFVAGAIEETVDLVPTKVILQADIPYTTSGPNEVLRLDEDVSYDATDFGAIQIQHEGCTLYSANGSVLTHATTTWGAGVYLRGFNVNNFHMYGMTIRHGGYLSASQLAEPVFGLHMDGRGNSAFDMDIHDNIISSGVANQISESTRPRGCIGFEQPYNGEIPLVTGKIYNNNLTHLGSNLGGGYGAYGLGEIKAFDNEITIADVAINDNGYSGGLSGGAYMMDNHFICRDLEHGDDVGPDTQLGFICLSARKGAEIGGNTFDVTNCGSGRLITVAEGADNAQVYYNKATGSNLIDVNGAGVRMLRYRFDAINMQAMYNTFDADNSAGAHVVFDAYGEQTLFQHDWLNGGIEESAAPAVGSWNRNAAGTITRISKTDNDAADVSADLAMVDAGRKIRFMNDSNPHQYVSLIMQVGVDMGTYYEYPSTIEYERESVSLAGVTRIKALNPATAREAYIYGNRATNLKEGYFRCFEIVQSIYSWDNESYGGENGMWLRGISDSQQVEDFWSYNDRISGTLADVRLFAAVDYPACVNANFNLPVNSPLNIVNDNPAGTVQNIDYFIDGDSGLQNNVPYNTGSRTPEAPTNLRVV